MPHALPLLDRIHITSPCDVPWETMRGDAHVRHCDQCDKHVYDLSSLTRPEAEALLQTHEGKLCVRYFRRADGTVLTADCPVGVARRRRRWLAFTALAVGSLAGVASLFVATATTGEPPVAAIEPDSTAATSTAPSACHADTLPSASHASTPPSASHASTPPGPDPGPGSRMVYDPPAPVSLPSTSAPLVSVPAPRKPRKALHEDIVGFL